MMDAPNGLSRTGKKAHKAVMAFLTKKGLTNDGGSKVFYSPSEWKARGEQYGVDSVLIVTHDGGDHAAAFTMDYGYKLSEELTEALEKKGLWFEQCTGWYSAVYTREGVR